MCYEGNLEMYLLIAAALFAAIMGFIAAAAAANGSIWYAESSPGLMAAAAGSAFGSSIFVGLAIREANDFFQCHHSPAACRQDLQNLLNSLNAEIVTLGIIAASCLAVARWAWIPIAPQAGMWALFAAAIIEIGVVPSIAVFTQQFIECCKRADTPETGQGRPELWAVGAAIVQSGVAVSIAAIAKWRRREARPPKAIA